MGFRGLWKRQMGQSSVIGVICRGIRRYWRSAVGWNPKLKQWSIMKAVTLEPILHLSSVDFIDILLSFISHCIVPFCFHSSHKSVPESSVFAGFVFSRCYLRCLTIISWMFWTMPPLQLILPILPVNLFPRLPGLCPSGPRGSQGLAASSWHGWRNWDSWDPWPPGLLQSTHHHQQPIKTRSFPLQILRKSFQVPSHHFNCCFILGHKTELFSNPWLYVTTSSSKWVVWIYHWFDC